MKDNSMNYLVTGGAGFIGSHIVETLVGLGRRVKVIDNLSTGKKDNIQKLLPSITFFESDINNSESVREAMEGVDVVIHVAAIPSVQRSVENPIASNQANVSGTLNMLNIARELKIKRFVYSASSSAYGNTPQLPKTETMPSNPLSPYAISKYVGELYCKTFADLYGLETISLRYFNVFGPRQDPASQYSAVIPKFISALMRDETPVIYGDGEQTRDFSYVENVVRANLLAATCDKTAGEVVNIACGERCSLNSLLGMLGEIIGKKAAPQYKPSRLGDVRDSLADISKARAIIGYEPHVFLLEGLQKTVAWFHA